MNGIEIAPNANRQRGFHRKYLLQIHGLFILFVLKAYGVIDRTRYLCLHAQHIEISSAARNQLTIDKI